MLGCLCPVRRSATPKAKPDPPARSPNPTPNLHRPGSHNPGLCVEHTLTTRKNGLTSRKTSASVPNVKSHFNSVGFNFTLLDKRGPFAMFSKRKLGHSRDSFEVVRLRSYPEHIVCGRIVPAGQCMPSAESWGVNAWTFLDRPSAQHRFDELCTRGVPSQGEDGQTLSSTILLPSST